MSPGRIRGFASASASWREDAYILIFLIS